MAGAPVSSAAPRATASATWRSHFSTPLFDQRADHAPSSRPSPTLSPRRLGEALRESPRDALMRQYAVGGDQVWRNFCIWWRARP